jgi:hypothetical protein
MTQARRAAARVTATNRHGRPLHAKTLNETIGTKLKSPYPGGLEMDLAVEKRAQCRAFTNAAVQRRAPIEPGGPRDSHVLIQTGRNGMSGCRKSRPKRADG